VWDTPSWNANYDQALAAVTGRVDVLLDELAASPCAR
jgi:hypothetical protein